MRAKKIMLILLSIFFMFALLVWLVACLAAAGQLYDTYDLWVYLKDAPVSVLIIVGLLAASVACMVAAFRTKKDTDGSKDGGAK